VYGAGNLGSRYDPVKGLELTGKFALPAGIAATHLADRNQLRQQFDHLRHHLDWGATMEQFDRYSRQAVEMVLSGKVQAAINLAAERDTARDVYGWRAWRT
jgi:hypothetical protein